MEQFAPLVRSKDQRPIRYLVVDDSIFARKNLAKMIESFGGQVAGPVFSRIVEQAAKYLGIEPGGVPGNPPTKLAAGSNRD